MGGSQSYMGPQSWFEVSSGHWELLRASKGEDSGREECPERPFLSLSEVVLLVTVGEC